MPGATISTDRGRGNLSSSARSIVKSQPAGDSLPAGSLFASLPQAFEGEQPINYAAFFLQAPRIAPITHIPTSG
jgi:hypothetical protein